MKERILASALAVVFAVPTVAPGVTAEVSAQIIDSNYAENVLWSSSFENTSGFKNYTDDRGNKNVKAGMINDGYAGDITSLIDMSSVSGTAAYNSGEVLSNIFDGDSHTKYLVSGSNVEVITKIKNNSKKTVRYYYLTSANDAPERDPKNWTVQARNSDSEGWVTIDTKTNQSFSSRYQTNTYTVSNPGAYSQYRLNITANYGGAGLTQFADYVLATGNNDDLNLSGDGMDVSITTGPVSSWNQYSNRGWSGSKSLVVSGRHIGTGESYANTVIYDNLGITVNSNTNLSYVIFPSMSNGQVYDFEYTQMHMAIDLKFTDGTYLSSLNAVDQNGNKMDADSQGKSKTLTTNQWNEIYSNIGKVATGKVIDKVIVVYNQKSHKDEEFPNFRTYFDDIKIYNQDTPVYSHLSDYVNILRGTNNSPGFSRGLTLPATLTPQGFNFYAPCTEYRSSEAYKYQNNIFKYMTVSHEPSYWVGDRGTWQFMVNTSRNASNASNYSTSALNAYFSHQNEVAKPYYYSVAFDGNGGDAANSRMEVAPANHAAFVRFTYSNVANKSVVFDCVNADGHVEFNSNTLKAYSDHTSNGSKRMYVYGVFSETPASTKVDSKTAIASFNSSAVTFKFATSYISYEQAQKNLDLDIGSAGFEQVKNNARNEWDERLGVVSNIKGVTFEQLVTFYSCLYRMYMYPNLYSENTGTNANPVWQYKSPYKGDSDSPVSGKLYVNNGFWDTYRTTWAAYGLLTPSTESELLNGLVQHYKDSGWVPRWIAPGGTNSMVGTSSDVIFADALAKGIDFDYENAYKSALKNAAVVSTNLTGGGRSKLSTSNFLGYASGGGENFSWSMEGYINDYGISQMARILADKTGNTTLKTNYLSESQYYLNRSKNYTKLFDNGGLDVSEKWLKGREANGLFTTGNYTNGAFDPFFWGNDYTETNAYNMSVSVPQDGVGVANLYGGPEMLSQKLDTIFETDGIYNGYNAVNGVGGIHEQKEAREVKLGQYGHSNQPSHHIPYMYLYSSTPWKTQYYVRDILDRCYVGGSFGQGYIGDEDNGEMSAWYVLSAMGFYPLTMGSDKFVIGSPLFKEMTINLESGKTLVIKAPKNSRDNVYVNSVTVNGQDYNKNYIEYSVLENGGVIEFDMQSSPNKNRVGEINTTSTTGNEKPDAYVDFATSVTSSTGVNTVNNLIDNSSDTDTALDNSAEIIFDMGNAKAVRMVTVTSASGRTPDRVRLYGDNGNGNWTQLCDYNDGSALYFSSWSKYTRPFKVPAENVGEYSRYRLVFDGSNASLSEIELLGYENNTLKKSDLGSLIDVANSLRNSTGFKAVNTKLDEAVSKALAVYDAGFANDDEIKSAYIGLKEMIDVNNSKVKVKDPSRIEAEAFDEKADAIVNDGNNIGGVKRNTWTEYHNVMFKDSATSVSINYAGKASEAGGRAEIYIDERKGEPVAVVDLPTTGEYWSDYVTVTAELDKEVDGLHNVYVVFKNNGDKTYVANVDYISFNTPALDETYSESLDILGFQISYVIGGMRTISTVENTINGKAVVESGNIYAIDNGNVSAADMIIGSSNANVHAYKSTSAGVLPEKFSDSETATDYAMTMINNGYTAAAFTQKYMIRAYAKLSDGSYVYSKVYSYSIYGIAERLYKGKQMSTYSGHMYLYDSILIVVDSSYEQVEYDWANSLEHF